MKTSRVRLTASRVGAFACPAGKSQAFLWDTESPSLMLRATPTGRKTYAFEGRLYGGTIRVAIGTASDWSLDAARKRAAELKQQVDNGQDPRELERQRQATRQEAKAAQIAQALTVGEAWSRYVKQRRPFWGERNYSDHLKMTQAGGEKRKRGAGLTVPGPLFPLLNLRLVELDAATVEAWAAKEANDRPARVRLALRLLKAFLRWASTEPELKGKADNNAASTKKAREAAGKAKAKNDYLQREQLAAWFEHVRAIPNPVISAYLQVLLLTGARREELGAMRWEDVNFQWKGLDLKDKIEGRRAIPLTPYVEGLLAGLRRRNEWVFSSVQALDLSGKNTERRARYHASKGQVAPSGDVSTRSASGRLVEPSIAHRRACAAAGLGGLTLHGLRRSFASLCEWLDIPGGISAQIQGHAPQGVREQNYIRRPLDLLRVHHNKIEAWMLEQAGVKFTAPAEGSAKPAFHVVPATTEAA